MLEKIVSKLLSGKWIMTIAITATLCYLAWVGRIEAKDFLVVATMVVGAYFGQSIAKGAK